MMKIRGEFALRVDPESLGEINNMRPRTPERRGRGTWFVVNIDVDMKPDRN
jgi:hypothetical protein